MPTGRHDARRSLYRRSRRKLPTGRPSWPGTEAQVLTRRSRRRGHSVALDPLARPVPTDRTRMMTESPRKPHPPIGFPSALRAPEKPMGGHRCRHPNPQAHRQSQPNLTAEKTRERYRGPPGRPAGPPPHLPHTVMPGLVPGIHVLRHRGAGRERARRRRDGDARNKSGHDDWGERCAGERPPRQTFAAKLAPKI